ncbi:hypothetical protein LCGC14_2411070 [marine sediment metagenome]|uniref:Uncharacterized protein n=1 Tax=marine sediment metagenome TaxID=412755 RepID=A0A0F9ELY6_9ZZZZ
MAHPWDMMQAQVLASFPDKPEEGFSFATGIHFGIVLALRHPEWVQAMHQAIEEITPHINNTDSLVDRFVQHIPLAVVDGGVERAEPPPAEPDFR